MVWQLLDERVFGGIGEEGGGIGEEGKGIKKHKLVVTEQSQRCKVQHREYSQ